jgi:hypothetical protein
MIRADTTKIIANPEKKKCPRVDQIRKLTVHNVAAKGPVWARSLSRKILGNEEFCLQIDAHTAFVDNWDEKLKQEWAATGNEFGILSTVPPALGEKNKDDKNVLKDIPRLCGVKFEEVGIPVRVATMVVWIIVHAGQRQNEGVVEKEGWKSSSFSHFRLPLFHETELRFPRRWQGRRLEKAAIVSCLESCI